MSGQTKKDEYLSAIHSATEIDQKLFVTLMDAGEEKHIFLNRLSDQKDAD